MEIFLLANNLFFRKIIDFFINLKTDINVDAKNANITVKKTMIAPIATPGPAYAWAAIGKSVETIKIFSKAWIFI